MREIYGDFFNLPFRYKLVTTNGDVNMYGRAVMGRGIALEARLLHPNLDVILATRLKDEGLTVSYIGLFGEVNYYSFPVKYHWRERAVPSLIQKSCDRLHVIAASHPETSYLLPRPGCGNGGLDWRDVEPLCRNLPDNVFVVTRYEGRR